MALQKGAKQQKKTKDPKDKRAKSVESWDEAEVVVHSSLGQRLIRHEWEASLLDVRLNKSLRTKAQRHFQRGQYLIGGRDESPPTIIIIIIIIIIIMIIVVR